jgi:hypothetical protein
MLTLKYALREIKSRDDYVLALGLAKSMIRKGELHKLALSLASDPQMVYLSNRILDTSTYNTFTYAEIRLAGGVRYGMDLAEDSDEEDIDMCIEHKVGENLSFARGLVSRQGAGSAVRAVLEDVVREGDHVDKRVSYIQERDSVRSLKNQVFENEHTNLQKDLLSAYMYREHVIAPKPSLFTIRVKLSLLLIIIIAIISYYGSAVQYSSTMPFSRSSAEAASHAEEADAKAEARREHMEHFNKDKAARSLEEQAKKVLKETEKIRENTEKDLKLKKERLNCPSAEVIVPKRCLTASQKGEKRRLLKLLHPDKNPGCQEMAKNKFIEFKEFQDLCK